MYKDKEKFMKDISIIIDDVKFNFRVGIVMKNNGRVLLEKGNDIDFSTIPGGRVKTLETVKSALIREIVEELEFNISNKEVKLQAVIENFFEMNKVKYHELYYVYKIELDDNNKLVHTDNLINKDSNDSRYNWVDIDKLDDVKILPVELKDVIKSNEFKTIVVNNLN